MIVNRLQGIGGVGMQPPYWWFQYGLWDLRVKCSCMREAWLLSISSTQQLSQSVRTYEPKRGCPACGRRETLTLTDFPNKLELDQQLECFRSHPMYGAGSK